METETPRSGDHNDVNTPYLVVEKESGLIIANQFGMDNALALMAKRGREPAACDFVSGPANVTAYLFASRAADAHQNRYK